MTAWDRTINFIAELKIGEEFSFDRFLHETRMSNRASAKTYRNLLKTAGYIARQRKDVYRKERNISRSISINKVKDQGYLRRSKSKKRS